MTTLPKSWIINRPILDNKERELLFIIAKSAGYIVSSTINDFLTDIIIDVEFGNYEKWKTYTEEQKQRWRNWYAAGSRGYMPYIGCGGIYLQAWPEGTLLTETNLSYNTVIETFKHIIKNRKI